LRDIKESYPVEVAIYAQKVGIDSSPAFSWWVHHTLKKKDRIISKIRSMNVNRYEKFGITVPKTVVEALELDRQSKTSYCASAIEKEMKNVDVAFKVLKRDEKPPPDIVLLHATSFLT